MKKQTKLSIQWFYNLLERGECDIMDFKKQLDFSVYKAYDLSYHQVHLIDSSISESEYESFNPDEL